MAFNPSIDVNSWKTIQWSQDVPKLDTQLTELMLKLSTWCTNAGQVLAAPAASVADSAIASVISQRTRGYSSIGNSTFEVDMRNGGALVTNPASGTFSLDRWVITKAGTMVVNTQQGVPAGGAGGTPVVPGSNFQVSHNCLSVTLTTQQASLGASDVLRFTQQIEGPMMRELINDVHSLSLLVSSTVAGLKFGVSLRDNANTRSLTKLCTIPSASTWTYITLPNLPIWDAGGTYSLVPGTIGYSLTITLAAGATLTAPANDTWQVGNFFGALGQSNYAASPLAANFYCAFCQHEPGNICTTPIDLDFDTNLSRCQRYYDKSYNYTTAPATATSTGIVNMYNYQASGTIIIPGQIRFAKRMAKTPTVTTYSGSSGASGVIRDATNGADRTVSAVNVPSEIGYCGVTISSPAASNPCNYQWQWQADTGW